MGELCARDRAARTGLAGYEDRFRFMELGNFRGETGSVEVDIQSAWNVPASEFFGRAHIDDGRAFDTVFLKMR